MNIPLIPGILRGIANLISEPAFDWQGMPTRHCFECGSTLMTIQAEFDEDYEISGYLLNAECAYCHTPLTAPTPLDKIDIIEK